MAIISYEQHEAVAVLTISRPDRRNALNHEGVADLLSGVRAAEAAGSRALVITGAGGHFCAGADLKELEDLAFTVALREALDALAETNFPTTAAIPGSCMGLGAQIALAADLRIATHDARFAVPVAKLGLMVDHWTVQRLADLAGHSTARWLTLTARPITAERAFQAGFVQDLVPGEADESSVAVLEAGLKLAEEIAQLAPLALAGTKLGLNTLERAADDLDADGSYRSAFERAWSSADLLEGQAAFRERRKPRFAGA